MIDTAPASGDYVLTWDSTQELVLGMEEAVVGVYVSAATEYPGMHWVQFDGETATVKNVVRVSHKFIEN